MAYEKGETAVKIFFYAFCRSVMALSNVRGAAEAHATYRNATFSGDDKTCLRIETLDTQLGYK